MIRSVHVCLCNVYSCDLFQDLCLFVFFFLERDSTSYSFILDPTPKCCIGVTQPTLKLAQTLEVFILFLMKNEKKKKYIKIKQLKAVVFEN